MQLNQHLQDCKVRSEDCCCFVESAGQKRVQRHRPPMAHRADAVEITHDSERGFGQIHAGHRSRAAEIPPGEDRRDQRADPRSVGGDLSRKRH